jgi:5'-phosphate synthase pdxT subunit
VDGKIERRFMSMKIGVLALQGAVAEHIRGLQNAGAETIEIKKVHQLHEIDGLVIPGGESTTIGRLMRLYGFIEPIREFATSGKPVFGTCAGLIVIAKHIVGQEESHLGLMDIHVKRNAFGRQIDSFEVHLDVKGIEKSVRAVFIRAPLITEVSNQVDILAVHNGEIVAARQNNILVTSFHPELTDDYQLHQYFSEMVQQYSLV